MWDGGREPNAYASDIAAWAYTHGRQGCCRNAPYPTEHMRWGLAGTADTMTFMHIDSDGFNTFLTVTCGLKVWGVYSPRSELPLSSINIFLHNHFRLDGVVDSALYDLEAVVLKPGNLLWVVSEKLRGCC